MSTAEANATSLEEQITALGQTADIPAYPIGKLDAHIRNIRHKAISIFVFDGDRLLLQKRADKKYHSGGLWANTVCSHPRWQESSAACASRRLQEELGWTIPLRHFGQIDYSARVGELYENEQVQCYVGQLTQPIDISGFNRDEVAAVEWVDLVEIAERIHQRPDTFTEWFKIYMHEHQSMIHELLSDRDSRSQNPK